MEKKKDWGTALTHPQIILLTDTVLFGEVGSGRYMGTYALASQLQDAGFRVLVIDYFTQLPNFFTFLEKYLSPDLLFVGMSTTFLAPFATVHNKRANRSVGIDLYYDGELWFKEGESLKGWFSELKKRILKHNSDAKVIIGGAKSQFSIWRKHFYEDVDYVCLGPGDRALVKAAHALLDHQPVAAKEFRGVKILENEQDRQNKFCPSVKWTKNFGVQPGEALPLEVARGCVFNCKFCHYDKKESFRKDQEELRKELLYNYEHYGTTTYHFCDDCFNDHPRKVESICQTLSNLPFKIEWVAYSRVDVAVKFPETMGMMVEAGAVGLYFGIESFNHQVALRAGKGTPTEKVKEFLLDFKNKYSARCLLEGSFITGLPGETRETQLQTADWIFQNPVFDFFTIGHLGIMPYVDDFDKLVFDYAEYSRYPEKYGFKKIDYTRRYWEHETFTSIEASELASQIKAEWNNKFGFQKIKTIWLYPHMRSLGYSKTQIFDMVRNQQRADQTPIEEIAGRFEKLKQNYWLSLEPPRNQFNALRQLGN